METKAVLFDWGGVLIEDPSPGINRFIHHQLRIDPGKTFHVPELILERFQRGEISETEFWSEVEAQLGLQVDYSGKSLWRTAFESTYQEKTFVFEWIKELRAHGIITAVLSNTEAPAVEMLLSMQYDCFDRTFFSCECGLIKPDVAIYNHALEQLALRPSQVLFIDDKQENIKAAKKLGLNTHWMRNKDSLAETITALGLPDMV